MTTVDLNSSLANPATLWPAVPEIVRGGAWNTMLAEILGADSALSAAPGASDLFAEALAAVKRQDFIAAIAALGGVLHVVGDGGPYAVAGHYMLGHINARLGNLVGVKEEWERALALDPEHIEIRINLAGTLIRMGLYDEALGHLARAESNAGSESLRLGAILEFRAFAHVYRNELEEAEAALRRAISLFPDHSFAHLQLADLFVRESARAPERREKFLRDAIGVYEDLLANVPNDPAVLNNLGAVLAKLGDDARAIEYYRRALSVAPEGELPAKNLALALVRIGNRPDAIRVLEVLAGRAVDDVDVYELLGALYADLGRFAEAERVLLRVIDTGGATARTYTNLGVVRVGQGNLEAAEQAIRTALERDPSETSAQASLELIAKAREEIVGSGLPVFVHQAAAAADASAFYQSFRTLDRASWTVSTYGTAIRLALEAGAIEAARDLATEGDDRFAGDEDLLKISRILAPTAVRRIPRRTDREPQKDRDWIDTHRAEYRGKWVALRNGTLIAAAETPERLIADLGDRRDVFLTKVA